MTRLVLGIDEAGRGPLLGAMVVAAVAVEPRASRRLARAGVTDSKAFGAGPDAHAARLGLFEIIRREATWIGIEICDVETVDHFAGWGLLNQLERDCALRFVRQAPPCARVIADGRKLFGRLRAEVPHLEAKDHAERCHVAVAAASICAKLRRDELYLLAAARYAHGFGEIRGGGYTNAATRRFALAYRKRFGALPPEARASWPWRGRPRLHRL